MKSSISPSVIDINGGAVGEVEDVAAGSITRAAGSTTVRAVKSGIEDEGDIGSVIGSASEGTSDMTSDSLSNVVAVDEEAEVEDDATFALALILAALVLADLLFEEYHAVGNDVGDVVPRGAVSNLINERKRRKEKTKHKFIHKIFQSNKGMKKEDVYMFM